MITFYSYCVLYHVTIKELKMKMYKVIKEFGCAQKGDVLHENEEGLFELCVECDCSDCYSSRSVCISADVADTLVHAGYLQEFEEHTWQNETVAECEMILSKVMDFVDEKIEQYTADHEALEAQYNEGDVPPCVKVEADTVYFNLIKVLNKIKEIINE